MRIATALALLSLAAATPALATNLIGQSATATFSSFAATSTNQFVSPAVVGAGTEFNGDFVDVFDQNWILGLDVDASSFTLRISESTRFSDGNISAASSLLDINLSGLTGLLPITLTSYSCTSAGGSCNFGGNGPDVVNLTSTATDASFGLTTLRDGETYVFSFGAVPEPMSWTMLLAGFGLVGAIARRRDAAVAA